MKPERHNLKVDAYAGCFASSKDAAWPYHALFRKMRGRAVVIALLP